MSVTTWSGNPASVPPGTGVFVGTEGSRKFSTEEKKRTLGTVQKGNKGDTQRVK